MNLVGPGFSSELDAPPEALRSSSALCGHVGFCFADFHFSAPGQASIEVEGAHIGVCLAPAGVTIERGRERVDLADDSIIARRPGSTGKSAWRDGLHGQYFFFAPESIERFFHMPMSRLEFGRDSVEAAIGKPVVSHLLAAAAHDLDAESPSGPMVMESLGSVALRTLASNPSEAAKAPRGLSVEQAKSVRELILERLDEALSLTEIAGAVGLSVGHMLRSFKTTFGVTPHQYIIRERTERAVSFIRSTQMSLSEIARASGFANRAQMTRTFRQTLGKRPNELRASA